MPARFVGGITVAPGRYRLRAELRESGYDRVRSGSWRVLIPR